MLPADTVNVGAARAFVSGALQDSGCHRLVGTAELLVSELAGNVVAHVGSWMEVTVEFIDGSVRIGVSDGDPSRPQPQVPTDGSLGGRGLLIVERLSSRWGVDTRADGKTVWFELLTTELPPQ